MNVNFKTKLKSIKKHYRLTLTEIKKIRPRLPLINTSTIETFFKHRKSDLLKAKTRIEHNQRHYCTYRIEKSRVFKFLKGAATFKYNLTYKLINKKTGKMVRINFNIDNLKDLPQELFWATNHSIRRSRASIIAVPHKLTLSQRFNEIKNSMRPYSKKKVYIGLEIECFGDINDLALHELNEAGTWYKDVDDSSIEFDVIDDDDETNSVEIVCLTSPQKLKKDAEAIERALEFHNVNSSCGYHVHLDMRQCTGRKAEAVFFNLIKCYNGFLGSMIPADRRNANYCMSNDTADYSNELNNNERYMAINAQAMNKHGTIEVRCHSGTTSAKKIYFWASILNKIADYKYFITSEDFDNEFVVAELFRKLKFNFTEIKHIQERISTFDYYNFLSASKCDLNFIPENKKTNNSAAA